MLTDKMVLLNGQYVRPVINADGSLTFFNANNDIVGVLSENSDNIKALNANRNVADVIRTADIVQERRTYNRDIEFINKSQGTGNGLQAGKQTWKLLVAGNTSGVTKNIIIGDFGGFIQALLGAGYTVTDYPQTFSFSPLSFFGSLTAASLLTAGFGVAPTLSNLVKNFRVNHVKLINTAAPQTPIANAVSFFYASIDMTQAETGLALKKSLLFPSNPVNADSYNASVYDTQGLDLIVGQLGAFVLQIPNGTPSFEFDMDVIAIDNIAAFAQNVSM